VLKKWGLVGFIKFKKTTILKFTLITFIAIVDENLMCKDFENSFMKFYVARHILLKNILT